jgi:hypothetical protein
MPEKYFYVTEQGLVNLKQYKYEGKDRSILAPYLQKWWNKAVTFLPMTMAYVSKVKDIRLEIATQDSRGDRKLC